ncbi:MAG: fused MFS/spermidine synthase [Rickettsiales bacterium]|nr:fused MFS/spermidine synthase [Rickettsiales bacterium]
MLLLVQPMLAKMLLPHVGGAPSVWIASMLFFQTMLLAGYGYAALTTRYLDSKTQWKFHLGLFVAAIAIAIPVALKLPEFSATGQPVSWVLLSLTFTIGAPYFILSASSSLLQRWYHSSTGEEPYFLFSASNAGSFLGLFSYPLLLEWVLDLEQQLLYFGYGFILLLLLFSGLYLWLKADLEKNSKQKTSSSLGALVILHTLFCAFLPSALFLALTLYITTDLGSFPLIWIIPLALYLLSFVIAFAAWGENVILACQKFHPIAMMMAVVGTLLPPMPEIIIMHFLAFMIIAISCHGQLARIRPTPEKLTFFFFFVSLGGALGGFFNVLAPSLFNDTYEYAGLVIISLLALPAKRKVSDLFALPKQEKLKILGGFSIIGIAITTFWLPSDPPTTGFEKTLYQSRNFYGVSKVQQTPLENGHFINRYLHGTTLHGMQSTVPELALEPTSYYSPIAKLIKHFPDSYYKKPFAVIGLGTGTTACYGRKGQSFDFFEIDPDVIKISQAPNLFTYLDQCPPTIRIIEGDGRIMLDQQPNTIGYNLLVIDAFTSDAIPMHLVTKEAAELYLKKLSPKTGMLAFNVSNRYYNLTPFITRISEELGVLAYKNRFKSNSNELSFTSDWVIVVPANSPWTSQITELGFKLQTSDPDTPLWTDNYSHIIPAIRMK